MPIFATPRPKVSRLVVTGAAGGIGTMIRGKLDHLAEEVVLSDLEDVEVSGNEVSRPCDITDLDALRELLKGGGDVLHFGGQSVEAPFGRICEANLMSIRRPWKSCAPASIPRWSGTAARPRHASRVSPSTGL